MLRLSAIAATLLATVGLAACGGGSNKAARNCYEIWNARPNQAQQASVAHRFRSGNVTRWIARASKGGVTESWTASSSKVPHVSNLGGSESHGCAYLFHTSKRYASFSAELRGKTVHWGVPPTLHGSWSRVAPAAAADNATVDAAGLLSPRSGG